MTPPSHAPGPPHAPPPTREYVLGTDLEEEARLGLQHRLWSAQAFSAWDRAGIRPGSTVLDAGCGPGYATLDLAELVGARGRVVGVDESPGFVARVAERARERGLANVEARVGDVRDLASGVGQAAPPGGFDACYARWVLCFVPEPERAVRSMGEMLRPGGRLCVQDYFNYESMTLAPKREAFSRVIRAVGASWRDRGGDPDLVGSLGHMLRASGLRLDSLAVNQRIARPGEPIWAWPDAFWRSFVPRLVASGFLSEQDRVDFFEAWREASDDPDGFMLLPPVFDLVATRV